MPTIYAHLRLLCPGRQCLSVQWCIVSVLRNGNDHPLDLEQSNAYSLFFGRIPSYERKRCQSSVVFSSRITNTLPWNSIVTYLRLRTISYPVLRYQCLYNWSNSAVIKSGEITAKKQCIS